MNRAATRAYRALLRLYPRDFRERFGAEMADTFDAAFAAQRGTRRIAFLAAAFLDVIRSSVAEHADDQQPTTNKRGTMESIRQDLTFAYRSLRRRPAFLGAVVTTLALGIGANTAIFSLVDAVLLHPLPIRKPAELLSIHEALNARAPNGQTAYPTFRTIASRTRAFEGVAGFKTLDAAVRIADETVQITVGGASGNYFSVLGVTPVLGRLFSPADDDGIGAHPVVVLSDAMWASAFDRSERAIGKPIYLGESPFTVIGVLPPEFRGTELGKSPRVWVPITMLTSVGAGSLFSGPRAGFVYTTHAFGWVDMIGRLRPGATAMQATAELNAIRKDIGNEVPLARRAMAAGVSAPMSAIPIVQAAALADRESLVRFVTILVGVVTLTLLVGCVNVANLQLVRASERARELGIRAALGAARGRIVRQLFLESFVLAALSAAAGVGVALVAMRLLTRFTLPGGVSLASINFGLDLRVLAFTALLAIATSVLFGLAPAIRSSRVDLTTVLKSAGGGRRRMSRGWLVGAQVALSLVLLVGAALFLRSLRAGLNADIGFDARSLAAISFDPRLAGYDNARALQLYDSAIDDARRIPGVTAAAVASHVPLDNQLQLSFSTEPMKPDKPSNGRIAGLVSVSEDYFRVLGVALVTGRSFAPADDRTTQKVAVINESAARAFFPNQSAIGASLWLLGMPYVVIGVVRDTKYQTVRDAGVPVVFAALRQEGGVGGMSLVVRTSDRAAALDGIRQILRTANVALPLHDARYVAEQVEAVLMPQRFGATLLSIFSAVVLCIATTGIFGAVSFGVSQRAQEIGIRVALGARDGDVVRLVVGRVMIASLAGVGVGLAASVATARGIQRFLYGVTPADAVSLAAATSVLCVAAVLAAWAPTRRALRIDPMTTIRTE